MTLVDQLTALAHLDIEGVHACNLVIDSVDAPPIRAQLDRVRQQHERHIAVLSARIRSLGKDPPAYSRGFKGFLVGRRAVDRTRVEDALRALREFEHSAQERYAAALRNALPADIYIVLSRSEYELRWHIDCIDQLLRDHA
jgi:hypothetical protein